MSYVSSMAIICEEKAYKEIIAEVCKLKETNNEDEHSEPLRDDIVFMRSGTSVDKFNVLLFDWKNKIVASPVYQKAIALAEEPEPNEGYMIKVCVLNEDNSAEVYDNSDGLIEGCELFIDLPESQTSKDAALKALYEVYKEDWLGNHVSSIERLQATREYAEYVAKCVERMVEFPTFEEYITENGYNGELYVCFEEFCDNELLDDDYRNQLIGSSECLKRIVEEELS